jgi:hypothetical protein
MLAKNICDLFGSEARRPRSNEPSDIVGGCPTTKASSAAINPSLDADGRRSRVDEVSDVVMSAIGT